MSNKMEELLNGIKLGELLHRKNHCDEKKRTLMWVLAIIGGVAAIAGIAYAVYRYMNPDYYDDFDDDYDDYEDDYDDDDFEVDDEEESKSSEFKKDSVKNVDTVNQF